MSKYVEPIHNMSSLRVNETLHGRSVHRSENVSGHNVFKGYKSPGTGDALDLFCAAGETVYAIADGVQIRWQNDATRLEVIYLQGDGWLAVYAHINAIHEGINVKVKKGEIVGKVRGDLNDPHVHFELWLGGQAVHAPTAGKLRMRMLNKLGLSKLEPTNNEPRLIVAKKIQSNNDDVGFRMNDLLYNEIPAKFDHRNHTFLVNTHVLAQYLGKGIGNLADFVPIRHALKSLGINDAHFDTSNLLSMTDPRVYVFVS